MHHKRITQREYEKVRKSLKSVNKLLVDAINVLEEDTYTETRLVDGVSALGNVLSNILEDSVPKWIENMKSALVSFGRVVIEAAMPQINIPDIMPKLNLGAELSQRFESVYKVPQIEIPAIEATKALYNSSGLKMASEIPAIESITATANVLNSYGKIFSDEMEENYSKISEDLESVQLTENDEEKLEMDSSASTDENP